MPKGMQGTRVTPGVVTQYKGDTTPKPKTSGSSAKNIRRPGQPGK